MADIYADDTTDDTTISYSTDYKVTPQTLSDSLQSNLDRSQKWSDNNKMILKETKTKAMLATRKWIKKRMINQALHVKDVRAHCYCAFFRACHAHVMDRRPRK